MSIYKKQGKINFPALMAHINMFHYKVPKNYRYR